MISEKKVKIDLRSYYLFIHSLDLFFFLNQIYFLKTLIIQIRERKHFLRQKLQISSSLCRPDPKHVICLLTMSVLCF